MMQPKVVIIILNWNGKENTVNCLNSASSITYDNYEALVVDNHSIDGSVECFEKEYPEITLIKNSTNLGFAEGNNVGIRRALEGGADYVLLLNNDTIVDRYFLDRLVAAAETDQTIGFAGPKIYYLDHEGDGHVISFAGGAVNMWIGRSRHRGLDQLDLGQYDGVTEVDYVEGSCVLAKKGALDHIGLLDATYFSYWEDVDWCTRGGKAGYKSIYVPTARIWHKPSSSNVSGTKTYYRTRNRLWFVRKRGNKLQYLTFFLFFFVLDAPFEVLRLALYHRDWRSLKLFVAGTLEGLKTPPFPRG
jgi:GT2 family glycosyltransferase